MQLRRSGWAISLLATAALIAESRPVLTVQGGGGSSTARPASPTVIASWTSHWSDADGTTVSLLVLWRGTPGWFAKGPGGGSGGGGGGGRGAYHRETHAGALPVSSVLRCAR